MKLYFEKIKNRIFELIKNKVFILAAVLLLIDVILGVAGKILVNQLPEQLGADRWSDEKKMSQVSVFFTEDQLIDADFIKKMEFVLGGKMTDVGILEDDDGDEKETKDSLPEIIDTQPLDQSVSTNTENTTAEETDDSRLYASCYSAQGLVSITFENKTAENMTAIGTSGDFFLFHPLELVSGSYYMPDAVMKDQIVIDEDLAWQLFGSDDVAGQQVTIGDVPHFVAGVVKRQEGRLRSAAGQGTGIAYLSYESLCKYGEILSGRTADIEKFSEDGQTSLRGGINCYEVVMPGPVDGIVAQIVKESTALDDKYISVVDNTDRFNAFSLFNVITAYGTRSMWNKAIFYPYWENLARGYEDILATFLLIRLICRLVVIAILTVFVIKAYRNKTWTVRGITDKLIDKKYDLEVKRKQKKDAKV